MEIKRGRRKNRTNIAQQPFPIFIASEIGISLHNWVPIICTGHFNGFGVEVRAVEEMSVLYNMGFFGKSNVARSKPDIIRKPGKYPRFMRNRQHLQRMRWWKTNENGTNDGKQKLLDLESEILNLQKEIDSQTNDRLNNKRKLDVIDLVSSDEDITERATVSDSKNKGQKKVDLSKRTEDVESSAMDLGTSSDEDYLQDKNPKKSGDAAMSFPENSILVVPDSDSQTEDYFKDLKPKLYINKVAIQEKLMLSLEEAYFLAFALGCLQIIDLDDKALSLEESWALFGRVQNNFISKYVVYHYYRSKGYVVKSGIKFGGDFILYEDGPQFAHGNHVVVIQSPECISCGNDWTSLSGSVRMAGTAVKEILVNKVTFPEDVAIEKLKRSPEHLGHFKIQELLIRRGIPDEESENSEYS